MIEVVLNDRLGKKIRVKCNEDDTIGDLKKMVAAQTGTRPEKIRIQKWYTVYKDHITLSDYEIHDDKCLSRGCRGGQQNNRGCPASTCALQQWLPPLRGVLLILAASSIGDFCCHCCCSGNSFHCRLLHPLARMGLELYYN
ncbi:hypothetical protein COHA_006390 [Chlorella ohadii]|uniref:Ubiquitin-like domain-containing protein n=1 Tax=Chlorella ohadii TaxID=2649997 RepID=A0AAD5DQ38_9CHLO|nr:hypothetical protein COHA_006390 [Chlorella ohadii]